VQAVLVARNGYFAAMLTGGLRESAQTEITLSDDVELEPFMIVVEYIYTKDLDKALEAVTESNIVGVFTLACRFDVRKLKSELESLLAYNVTSENAESFMELADQLSAHRLLAHCKTVMSTDS